MHLARELVLDDGLARQNSSAIFARLTTARYAAGCLSEVFQEWGSGIAV